MKNENNNNLLSIDYDDDNENYKNFSEFLSEDTLRNKNKLASEINDLGDDLFNEICEKNVTRNKKKEKYIKYILKHSDEYTQTELLQYDLRSVIDIFNEIKEKRRSRISKFFDFLFEISPH